MAQDDIIALIDEEIDRLQTVRRMLEKTEPVVARLATRKYVRKNAAAAPAAPKSKRVLSPEARKKIADAQKKRWAAQKSK